MHWISRLSVLLAVVLVTQACGDEPPPPQVLRPIQVLEVGYAAQGETRTFSGTAQTDKVINLSFRNTGIITVFNIRLGQRVRKGDLLAELDNVQSRLAHEQALSSLNSAASQMNTAKLALDRVRALYEKGSSSLSDYENAKNSFRTAEASHQSAQRSVDIQEEQMRYGYIYAPENGTIASVHAEIDENVGAGQAVAVLNAGTTMEIALGLPESIINQIAEDMMVEVTFSSLSNQTYAGTVTEVSPSVDPQTATYPVRVTLAGDYEDVRSGMTANVTFSFDDQALAANTLVVPAKAVGEDSDGRFVYLLESSDGSVATARKRHIEIGGLTAAGFEVLGGLEAGQQIATAGLQTLLNGQQVRIQ